MSVNLRRLTFVNTGWPDQATRQKNFNINQNYPAKLVHSKIPCTAKKKKKNDQSGRPVLTFGKCPLIDICWRHVTAKKSLIPTDLAALTKALWTIQAAKFLGNRETIMWELKLLNLLVYLTLIYFDEDQEAGEDFV